MARWQKLAYLTAGFVCLLLLGSLAKQLLGLGSTDPLLRHDWMDLIATPALLLFVWTGLVVVPYAVGYDCTRWLIERCVAPPRQDESDE